MKKLLLITLVGIVMSVFVGSVLAGGHGGRGGHSGGRISYSSHGGGHTSYSFSFGFGDYRPRPYYYPPPYRYYPYSYPVVVERPVIVERPVVITQPAPVIVQQVAPVQVYTPMPERLVDGRVKGEVSSSQTNIQTTVIWIANDNGSQTPVELRQQGTGFVGPSNEYYSTMPTQEQLKAVYGLKSNVQPAADTVTVIVNNSDGTKTPVVLKKEGTEFIGPKGEHYPSLPTEEQLKQIYGK